MTPRVIVLLLAALTAAGCGAARHAAPATATSRPTTAARAVKPCKLDAAQRRAVRLSLRDIRKLRQIQAPLQRFTERGTPAQEAETGRFLADMSAGKLPIKVRAHLLHLAKSAVVLCGLCFDGLESAEPVLAGRMGEKRCG
jgi:hypothetical protein